MVVLRVSPRGLLGSFRASCFAGQFRGKLTAVAALVTPGSGPNETAVYFSLIVTELCAMIRLNFSRLVEETTTLNCTGHRT